MGTLHYYFADGRYDTARADAAPQLSDLQEFVSGYVEVVWVLFRGKRAAMLVNEDGHRLGLPFNTRGTEIYHEVARQRGLCNPNPILGNALVLEDIELK